MVKPFLCDTVERPTWQISVFRPQHCSSDPKPQPDAHHSFSPSACWVGPSPAHRTSKPSEISAKTNCQMIEPAIWLVGFVCLQGILVNSTRRRRTSACGLGSLEQCCGLKTDICQVGILRMVPNWQNYRSSVSCARYQTGQIIGLSSVSQRKGLTT